METIEWPAFSSEKLLQMALRARFVCCCRDCDACVGAHPMEPIGADVGKRSRDPNRMLAELEKILRREHLPSRTAARALAARRRAVVA